MTPIRVVTDSGCDLPASLRERFGITVVPCYLTFGDQVYRYGVDITPQEIVGRLRGGEFPRLSQPAPGDFLAAYRALAYGQSGGKTDVPSIISIHVTSRLSGTYNSASLASKMVPDLDITLIDSRTGSMGAKVIVLEAARLAQAGKPKDDILEAVRRTVERSAFYLIVRDLNHLHRAGRLGKLQAWLGKSLSLFPVIAVREGVVMPYRLARSYRQALKALVSAGLSWSNRDGLVNVAAVHVDSEADAGYVLTLAERSLKLRDSFILHAGGVAAAALGPGTVGLCLSEVSA